MLLKIEVQTLEAGKERRESFKVEAESTKQGIVDLFLENDFRNIENVSVEQINDAVS